MRYAILGDDGKVVGVASGFVAGGVPVPDNYSGNILNSYLDGESFREYPDRPMFSTSFDYVSRQWISHAPSIDDMKAEKISAVTMRRVQEDQRFQFGGKWFQADAAAWKQISGVHGWVSAQNTMPPGWIGQWKAEDNTFLPIPDPATWWQFYGAVLARGSSNFMRGEALKAQIAAATTAEEVAAVPDW